MAPLGAGVDGDGDGEGEGTDDGEGTGEGSGEGSGSGDDLAGGGDLGVSEALGGGAFFFIGGGGAFFFIGGGGDFFFIGGGDFFFIGGGGDFLGEGLAFGLACQARYQQRGQFETACRRASSRGSCAEAAAASAHTPGASAAQRPQPQRRSLQMGGPAVSTTCGSQHLSARRRYGAPPGTAREAALVSASDPTCRLAGSDPSPPCLLPSSYPAPCAQEPIAARRSQEGAAAPTRSKAIQQQRRGQGQPHAVQVCEGGDKTVVSTLKIVRVLVSCVSLLLLQRLCVLCERNCVARAERVAPRAEPPTTAGRPPLYLL